MGKAERRAACKQCSKVLFMPRSQFLPWILQVGEHDSCGPGNLKNSGFSYDPESFMAARVGFYNFSWRDMGVPDLDRMMDIVQVGLLAYAWASVRQALGYLSSWGWQCSYLRGWSGCVPGSLLRNEGWSSCPRG